MSCILFEGKKIFVFKNKGTMGTEIVLLIIIIDSRKNKLYPWG
jgi:hypothetical protein